MHCYCDQLSSTNVFTDPLCKAWLSAKVTAIAITLVASSSVSGDASIVAPYLTVQVCVQVVVMNTVLSRIMRMLTKFEKHHSLDDEARSLSVRLFLTLFVNTGIVVLIANASFTFFKGSLGQRYSDFVPAWYVPLVYLVLCAVEQPGAPSRYQTVGSSILITMALNIGFGQAISVLRLVQALCARRYVKPINQRQMNDLLTGPEFVLSTRYAQVINTVCLRSSSIPVQILIVC